MALCTDESARKAKADAAGDKLCEAIAVWWRELGGVPLVAGGITLRGLERHNVYELCIRVTGTRPSLTYELPPEKKKLKLRHEVAKKKRQRK